jgi:large subunit ribosomal protein L23Ae
MGPKAKAPAAAKGGKKAAAEAPAAPGAEVKPKSPPAAKKPAPAAGGSAVKGKAAGRALKVKKSVLKGAHGKRQRKIRTDSRFRRPKTKSLPRAPKFPRKSAPARNKMDAYSIIKHPLTTESAMKKIEDNNTLVFLGIINIIILIIL